MKVFVLDGTFDLVQMFGDTLQSLLQKLGGFNTCLHANSASCVFCLVRNLKEFFTLHRQGTRIMKDFKLKCEVLLFINALFAIDRELKFHVNELVGRQF